MSVYEGLRGIMKEKLEHWQSDVSDDDVMDIAYDLKEILAEVDSFKLYRYMPVNYFNIRNFETQKIHLSPNGVLNDIYEGLPELDESITYEQLQQLDDMAYMVCMSETNNSPLMWSHYAKNHTGICVEYDLKKLEEEPFDLISHLFPVVYNDERKIFRDFSALIESHKELKKAIAENYVYDGVEDLDDILPLFLNKGTDWEYEKEWRILFSKKQMYDIDDNRLYEGNLHFKCITGVYLGYRIHPEIKDNIKEICNRISNGTTTVTAYQARLDSKKYTITFDKVQ